MSFKVGTVADLIHKSNRVDATESNKTKQSIDLIYREAAINSEYYLNQARLTGKPWYHCIKKPIQYSEFIMVSREMAQELKSSIWSVEDGNRKVKRMHVEAIQRDIEGNRWLPTHESIAIDTNNEIGDGQHRINAFLNSTKNEVCFYITFNVLPEAKFAIDSGSKRTSAEKLSMIVDKKWGPKVTGLCRAMMRGLNTKVRFTDIEIAEFATQWQPVIDWLIEHIPNAPAEIKAAIGKMYIFYGPDLLIDFCDRYKNIRFTEEGDPAKALYVSVDRIKGNRDLKRYRITLSALNALVNKRKVKQLRDVDSDIFDWSRGVSNREWNAPKESWYVSKMLQSQE